MSKRKRVILFMGENEVQTLKTDVSQLKTDVSELKIDVSGIKVEVAEIKVEVRSLKEDMVEIKTDVKELIKIVNINHLYFVDTYVKKTDFQDYKREEIIGKRWLATYIIGAITLGMGILKIVFPYSF